MGHGAGHHIEHAEHAAHAASDWFNTRVTITIAILAAVLAAVTIQGHRAHNLMLSAQIKSTTAKNEAANKWTQFQAYNIRYQNYKAHRELASFAVTASGSEESRNRIIEEWTAKIDEYKNIQMPMARKEAEGFTQQSEEWRAQADHWHHKAERFDLGDLGLQMGVVLSSLAILTKRRSFWFAGIISGIIGLSIAASSHFELFLGDHNQHDPTSTQHNHSH